RTRRPCHRTGGVGVHRGSLQPNGPGVLRLRRTHMGGSGQHRRRSRRHVMEGVMDGSFIAFSLVKIVVVLGVVLTMVAYAVLVERKVSAFIQDRVGPNRAAPFFARRLPVVGPALVRWGLFQP